MYGKVMELQLLSVIFYNVAERRILNLFGLTDVI
jgi:hypothetical protein